MNKLYSGVCPVMLTPYTPDNEIDFDSLKKLTDWYIESGASSLFAVCQSSEMFLLSSEERIAYAEFVKANSSVPVFAVGNVSENREEALEEIKKLIDAGIDGVVLITNTLVKEGVSGEEWQEAVSWFLERIPKDTVMGLYECPIPYKHLITDSEMEFIVKTGRFAFLKDTCCDAGIIKKRLQIIGDAPLSLFNANSTTLLDTLKMGCAGFCGIMGNFNTRLCVWLCDNWQKEPQKAEYVQSVLSVASKFGDPTYPFNAKFFLEQEGIINSPETRNANCARVTELDKADLEQLKILFNNTERLVIK